MTMLPPEPPQGQGGGGSGTSDHAALTSLDYPSAGHTGFSPSNHTHPALLPSGGSADQVLAKIDGTDFNTHWVAQSGVGGGDIDGGWSTSVYTAAQLIDGGGA